MPGCAIAVRPVGVLKMVDESGGDEKIVAVPVSRLTQRYDRVHNYTDLPEILWRQIEHFFAHYKDLEPGKWSKFDGWGDAEHAKDLIEQAIARASKLQRVREVVIGLSLLRLPGVGIERARRSRRAACRLSTGNMLRAAAKAAPVEKAEATKAKRSINPR
jgi:hypothetical protein